MDIRNKRITVTGGCGFLGSHVIAKLADKQCTRIDIADLPDYDLTDMGDILCMYQNLRPEIVIHLAARARGIGFNQGTPASLFYENALMGMQLMHVAHLSGTEKFVALGTICVYPKNTDVPFREEDLWNGYPEEIGAPYGLAKKMLLVQSQAYRTQFDFNSIFLIPGCIYGPGDNFKLRSCHVIPAIIRKFHLSNLLARGDFDGIIIDLLQNGDNVVHTKDLKIEVNAASHTEDVLHLLKYHGISLTEAASVQPLSLFARRNEITVELWGTGNVTREFLYVEDAAEAIVQATERYDKSEPVNIGAGFELSIGILANLIKELMGFEGNIVWNGAKPDGQQRRALDTTKASKEFGFRATTDLREGLTRTIEWYVTDNRHRIEHNGGLTGRYGLAGPESLKKAG